MVSLTNVKMTYMEIKRINQKCWQIKTKKEVVLVNPDEAVLRDNKITSRIVIYTETHGDFVRLGDDGRIVIAGPGEYEVGGVEISGLNGGEGRLYVIAADGVSVGVLGAIKEKLTDKKVEKINGVDALIPSVGYEGQLPTKDILDLAKSWGANYLVPMGFEIENSEEVKKFLDDTDNEGLEPQDSLKIEADNLPDGMEVVLLKY